RDGRSRAYMDVLVACPARRYPPRAYRRAKVGGENLTTRPGLPRTVAYVQNYKLQSHWLPLYFSANAHIRYARRLFTDTPHAKPRQRLAGCHPLRPAGPGAGNRPGLGQRRRADAGLRQPRSAGVGGAREPRHLLVALQAEAVAQGRGIRPCAGAARP